MADRAQQDEPTMEEILASIRRIIADEGEPPAERQDDVLELTERVDDHGEPVGRAPRSEPDSLRRQDEPVPEIRPEPVFEPPPQPVFEREPPPPPPPPPPAPAMPALVASSPPLAYADQSEAERLLSEESESASAKAFAEIASFTRARREMLMGNGERTLEELTRELLRPLLKDWLDQNLPGLVQRLVKEEIERMVRQGAA